MIRAVADEHKSVGIQENIRGIVELAGAASLSTISGYSDTSTRSVRPLLDAIVERIGNVHAQIGIDKYSGRTVEL